jgi:hypothetical protein
MKSKESSTTGQTHSHFKGMEIVGFIILISIILPIFSVRNALANNQSPSITATSATSRSRTLPKPSTVVTQNRSQTLSTVLISQAMGGALTVSNGTNRDAFVKLIEPNSGILLAGFFVKSNSSYTLEQIPDGTYRVLFALGQGWNPNTQVFTKNKQFAKFNKPLAYTTTQLSNSIQYKVFKITLHPVVGGQARTSGVSEQEFNRY